MYFDNGVYNMTKILSFYGPVGHMCVLMQVQKLLDLGNCGLARGVSDFRPNLFMG